MKRALKGIALVLALAACGTAAFGQALKTPYLIYPGLNTTMEVLWQDSATQTDTLSWGTTPSYGHSTSVAELASTSTVPHQHMYTITGLTPNSIYYYQVAVGSTVYKGSFITAPAATATAVKFLGMGDSRSYPYALNALMAAMKSFYSQPGNAEYQRLTIHNGDWVSSDGESYWTTQWFTGYPDIVNFTANSPIDGTKGNHDNGGSYPNGYSSTFPKYYPFPFAGKTATGNNDSSGNPYYSNLYWSFDYGPVHFTVVDEYSNFAAPSSAQYLWLVNDLSQTTKPWKILIYHEPAYSSGSDADNTTVRALEPLVTQYHVDMIYCGHSHNYARTGAYNTAQANGDQIALNVPHITTGGGGAPIYQPDYTNSAGYPHVITAWPAYEFMTFNVQGETLEVSTYQVNGVPNSGGSGTAYTLPASTLNLSIKPIETLVLNHFTNVSNEVSVTAGPITCGSSNCTGSLTVTNTSGSALKGNVDVVLDGMLYLQGIGNADNQYSTTNPKAASKIAQNPACGVTAKGTVCAGYEISDVTLVNATGSNNGEPMIRISSNGIASGKSVVVPLTFTVPTVETISSVGGQITFTNNSNSTVKIAVSPVVYQE